MTIIVENCENEEFLNKLKELTDSFSEELSGNITLNLSNIEQNTNSISAKWYSYCIKSNRFVENDDVLEWSPNDEEIKELSIDNVLLDKLTSNWRGNYERYQSNEDLTKILSIIKSNKDLKPKDKFQEIKNTKDLENKFLEIIDLFYSRNPKFKYDW